MEENNLLKAEQILKNCLEEIPFLTILDISKEFNKDKMVVDIWVKLKIPSGYQELVIVVKKIGEPRIIRDTISRLTAYLEYVPNSYGIVIAPFIFTKSAEICKKAGVGFLDFAGNCFLSFQQIYIVKERKPKTSQEDRILRSLYYPKAERVLRVLLNNPNKVWQIKELAEQSVVSLGMSSKVKRRLDTLGWIRSEAKGFRLTGWEELVKEWSSRYDFRKNSVYDFYSMENESVIEQALNDYCTTNNIPFALTLFSGAARIAPYTIMNKVFAYVEKDLDQLKRELKLQPVSSGSNVTLLFPYDSGVFYGAKDYQNIKVVSPIQLYLDLKNYKGRGEEAAQFLYQQKIKPLWSQDQITTNEK